MILKEFPGKDEKKLLSQIEAIFDLKYRSLISIFDLGMEKNANDLDEAVLKAFLKANESDYMTGLCISWNRFDIVKNFILNENFSGNVI
jgi:hypothetical protein